MRSALVWLLVILCLLAAVASVAPGHSGRALAFGADITLYEDALRAPWQDWSYGLTADNLASTSPVFLGANAIRFTYGANYGALKLHATTPTPTLGTDGYLHFAVRGDAANPAGEALAVAVTDQNGAPMTTAAGTTVPDYIITPSTGAWQIVSAPLSAIDPRGAPIGDVYIKAGTRAVTYSFDDVRFTNAPPAPSGLHVSGNKLLDIYNNNVILHGLNHGGTDFECAKGSGSIFNGFVGTTDRAAITAMAQFAGVAGHRNGYGVNVVRIEVNQACWLGYPAVPAGASGAAYQQAIVTYVRNLHNAGLAVILGLHNPAPEGKGLATEPMPDDQTPTLWGQLATTFKGDSSLILDPYNEPSPMSNQVSAAAWACWRDGDAPGQTTCGTGGYDNSTSPPTVIPPYHAQGMQSIVNAIRNAGNDQPILLGGIGYAGYVDRWETYQPNDPAHQLMADVHSYGQPVGTILTTSQYDASYGPFITAGLHPLLFAEIGDTDCEAGASHIDSLMPWADGKGVGYLAWLYNNWDCSQGPSLITGYSGGYGSLTPYGQHYWNHLVTLNQSL